MAKLLLVCHRDRSNNPDHGLFQTLSKAIIPDNIEPRSPHILASPGLDVGVINPNSAVLVQNTSVCLGNIIDPADDWDRPLALRPDGSFALIRADERCIELVSDACASRTLWYVLTDSIFVASTSQRAIVAILGNYHSNPGAIAWMLSAGNLGPGLSWDSRIKCLEANASVVLDRHDWSLKNTADRIEFAPRDVPDQVHREEFVKALRDVFGKLRIDHAKWRLLLSGGFDSRCILMMLENKVGLRSITWGLASALVMPGSDAVVARSLASHFGVAHDYYTTDIASEDIGKVFARLLVAGEGRTDVISAYMDGCDIWRRLYSAGIAGVIRGDSIFSPYRVYSEYDVRRIEGARFLRDYDNLARFSGFFGVEQCLPDYLYRRPGESLSMWRDRFTIEYRCPVVWAALSEIKSSYVELMNPLLSRRLLDALITLPDHLRDGRTLYKRIISDMSPAIGFAEHNAIENKSSILSSAAVVRHLVEALDSADARTLLPDRLISYILDNVRTTAVAREPMRRKIPGFIMKWIPERMRKYRLMQSKNLDVNLLALRAYIVVAMDKRLKSDARIFKP